MRLKDVLLKDSIVYGFTMNLSILSAIFLTPIYTRMIPDADYGIMDIFNTWNAMISNIIPFGMISVIMIFYNEVKNNPEEKRRTFGSMFMFLVFVSIIFSLLASLFYKMYLNTFIGQSGPREIELFYENILIIVLTVFQSYVLWILRAKFQKYFYLTVSVSNFLILSLGGFIMVYFFKVGLVGFFRASVLALLFSVGVGLYLIRDEVFLTFDFKRFKHIFSVSIHFLSVLLLLKLVDVLGRYFMKEYSPQSLSDIGLYAIGARIAGIIMFLLTAFSTAWYPYALSIKDDPDADQKINKVHDIFFTVCGFIALSIIIFRYELIMFFAPLYKGAYSIIPFLLLTNIFHQTAGLYTLGLYYTKQTKYISYSAAVSMIVNVTCSYLLIRTYGVIGYAIAGLLGVAVWVLLQKYYSQKMFFIKFNYKIVLLFALLYVAAIKLSDFVDPFFSTQSIMFSIAAKAGMTLLLFSPILIYVYTSYREVFIQQLHSIKNKLPF